MKKVLFYSTLFLITFLSLEIVSRVLLDTEFVLKKLSIYHSSYRRISWIRNFKYSKELMNQRVDQFDPVLGWKLKQNLQKVVYFEDKTLSTNSDGYRNNFEFKSNDNNIILLGDSFVFGEEVNDAETFASLLNKDLSNYKFINLGVKGYGHDQMLLTLKRYIQQLKPKIVILFINFTDFERNILSFHDYFKPYYSFESNNELRLHTEHIIHPKNAKTNEFFRIKLIDLIKIIHSKYTFNRKKYHKDNQKIGRKILEEFIKTAREHNTKIIFSYIPIATEPNNIGEEMFSYEKFMFNICEEKKILCFSTKEEFLNLSNRKGHVFKEKGHWREKGHKAVYLSVKKFLKENKLLSH